MFDELDKTMRQDQDAEMPPQQRWMRNTLVLLLAVVLFGALYAVFRFVEA